MIVGTFQDLFNDFNHHNIELVAALMESCGRYLYLSPECHKRMEEVIETVQRLRKMKHFDMRQNTLIESAIYIVKPPERKEKPKVEMTVVQKYIKFLFNEKLGTSEVTVDTLIMAVRKLPWQSQEEDVEAHILKACMSLTESKYVTIPILADFISGINKYQPNLAILLVDTVLETLLRGLEAPFKREPQKLLGAIRLIGEMYNYEVLGSSVIYDVLYLIINHSHEINDEEELAIKADFLVSLEQKEEEADGGETPPSSSLTNATASSNDHKVDKEGKADSSNLYASISPSFYYFKGSNRIYHNQKYDPRKHSDVDRPSDTFR